MNETIKKPTVLSKNSDEKNLNHESDGITYAPAYGGRYKCRKCGKFYNKEQTNECKVNIK